MDEPFWQMPGKRVLSPKVAHLRQKLYQKAKQEPGFRFYTLYEAVCRMDVLLDAWQAARKNDGCPGVDRVSFKQIEESPEGVRGFLRELRSSLLDGSYRPQPVKRVYIEKANGKLRPLSHPDHSGSRGADGGGVGDRADLRGGLPGLFLRIPS